MQWIAPSEKDQDNAALEKRLWDAADQFRANSGLKSQEYSAPVLGLIFLRFAEVRFAAQRAKLEKASASARRGSRVDEPAAYHAEGILYLDRGVRGAVVRIRASDRRCWNPPSGAKSGRGHAGARFLEQPVDGTPLREEGIDDIQSTFIGGHILRAVRRDAAGALV